GEHRTARLEQLAGDLQAKAVQAREGRQIRTGEGSVGHVGVFLMGGVGTSIFGRPRPLHGHRRASALYTLNCEEPYMECHLLTDISAPPGTDTQVADSVSAGLRAHA